jgi:REP element-mobilizing transposase RayT
MKSQISLKSQKQLGFDILNKAGMKHFGGDYLKNSNAKEKRPISTKKAMHLVVRSTMAKGSLSFLRYNQKISAIIYKQAKDCGVKVYRFANAGNHLHMVILPSSRIAFMKFIRAITGLIARLVLKAEKGSAKSVQFWDKRPFTRIIEWGKEFKGVVGYLTQNTLEALRLIPYKPRKKRYKLSTS